MGSSVTLVFVLPALIWYFISGGTVTELIKTVTAKDFTEIVLPYDAENGTVWEYDNQNDIYIELYETRIDGDKQIFVFENAEDLGISEIVEDFVKTVFGAVSGETHAMPAGEIMDIVFIDKNGNKRVYYAQNGVVDPPIMYPAEECITTEYTVTPEKVVEGAAWDAFSGEYILYTGERASGSEASFTLVATPPTIQRTWFAVEFAYVDKLDFAENFYIFFDIEDGAIIESGKHIIED